MSIKNKLRHWFTPHHTNNFRARLLHNTGIFGITVFVIGCSLFIRFLNNPSLHILGFTSSVTLDSVFADVNKERLTAGLKPLSLSGKLSDAARRKAANMFAENYWAHNAPSGKNPWHWFNEVHYNYTYAGENLAKDFGDTERMVVAWMNSPTHKANIINSHYTETGIAVVPGSLLGSDTVLVVQLFGAPAATTGTVPSDPSQGTAPAQIAAVQGESTSGGASPQNITSVPSNPQSKVVPASSPVATIVTRLFPSVDQFLLKKTVAMGSILAFLLALVLDLVIAESKVLSRRVGKNWAHIVFINVILLLVTIAQAGSIQ